MQETVPPLQHLSQTEFDDLRLGAEVLEQDSHGPKVLRLPNGDMLKLFRVKRLWSSAQLFPYSKRFCRNATRLKVLGVPTLSVKAWYRLPNSGLTAVVYSPLPGQTLRQIGQSGGLDIFLLQRLGSFVADLHQQGIYFRSLHLGNIVQTPVGKLGLIDIADLSVKPWNLFCFERIRNFRHLCRLAADREIFGEDGWDLFLHEYSEASQSKYCKTSSFLENARKLYKL